MKITDILEVKAAPIDYSVFVKPDMTEKEQMFVLSKKGQLLKDILAAGNIPSEKVQMFIVKRKKNGFAALLRGKIRPSEEVILTAIAQNGTNITRVVKAKIQMSDEMLIEILHMYPGRFWMTASVLAATGWKPSDAVLRTILLLESQNAWDVNRLIDAFIIHKLQIPKDLLNSILTNDTLINTRDKSFSSYDNFVKYVFKDNTVLANKWLRYAENMRQVS
jgi:hypothetical protein